MTGVVQLVSGRHKLYMLASPLLRGSAEGTAAAMGKLWEQKYHVELPRGWVLCVSRYYAAIVGV